MQSTDPDLKARYDLRKLLMLVSNMACYLSYLSMRLYEKVQMILDQNAVEEKGTTLSSYIKFPVNTSRLTLLEFKMNEELRYATLCNRYYSL